MSTEQQMPPKGVIHYCTHVKKSLAYHIPALPATGTEAGHLSMPCNVFSIGTYYVYNQSWELWGIDVGIKYNFCLISWEEK